MNCHCGLAVKQRFAKEGENVGKPYFTCPTMTCSLFVWLGNTTMPVHIESVNTVRQLPASESVQLVANTTKKIVITVQLHRIDNQPFNAWFHTIHSFNQTIINYYKTIPDTVKRFDEAKKIWIFDFKFYEDFVCKMHSSEYSFVELVELPKFICVGLKRYTANVSNIADEDIHLNIRPSLYETLKEFQIKGAKFVIKCNGRAYIADEMGCGKSIQAIACLEHYQDHWPALILAPPQIISQWKAELIKFCIGLLREQDIGVIKSTTDSLAGKKVCLIPYSMLNSLMDAGKIKEDLFGVVICDESHMLKNKDSKRTNIAVPFLKKARIAICLSGTPATNRPVELYTQLNALLPKIFCDYDGFTRRYCDAKPSNSKFNKGNDVKGCSNPAELRMLLEGLVMIRRLKSEVAHELPQKDREIKYLNPDPCYLPEIKRLKAEGDQIYRQMKDPRNDSAAQKKLQSDQQGNMVRQYSVCGLSKIKGVIEEIVLLLEEAKLVKPDRDRSTSAVPISTEVINLYEAPEIASPVSSRLEEDVLSEVKKSFVAEDEEWMRGSEDDEVSKRPPSRLKRKSAHRVLLDCNDEDDDDFLFEDHKLGEPNKSSKRKAGSNRIQSASSRITSSTTDDYDSAEDEGAQAWKDLLKGKGKSTHKSKAKVKGSQSKSEIGDGRAEKLSRRDEVEELGLIRGVQSKKIIVFAHHKEVMNALEDLLRDYGVSYIRVDGEVTQNKRDVSIKKFQEDDVTDIALLSVTACGTGLNLTRANIAVFAELAWSHGSVLQAEDRIHRIGQTSDVRVIYLLARDTSDEVMWRQMQSKHEVLASTIGVDEKKGSGMNAKALRHESEPAVTTKTQRTVDVYLKQQALPLPYAAKPSAPSSSSSSSSNNSAVPVAPPANPCVTNISSSLISSPSARRPHDISQLLSVPFHKDTVRDSRFSSDDKHSVEFLYSVPDEFMPPPQKVPLPAQQHPYKLTAKPAASMQPVASSMACVPQSPPRRVLSPGTIARIEKNKMQAIERKRLLGLSAPVVTLEKKAVYEIKSDIPLMRELGGMLAVGRVHTLTSARGTVISYSAEEVASAAVHLRPPVSTHHVVNKSYQLPPNHGGSSTVQQATSNNVYVKAPRVRSID